MVTRFDHISPAFDHASTAELFHEEIVVVVQGQCGGRMTAIIGVVSMVTVAALTPGPNNLIVLRTAARDGIRGTIPAIVGVVAGGLTVLTIASVATAAAVAIGPGIRGAVGIAGAAYLAWLGLALLWHAGRSRNSTGGPRGLPVASVSGLFAFQFLNPKSWVMAMTALGASPAAAPAPWWQLGAVFATIPTICLLLWAGAGAALTRLLARPRVAAWVDRVMGAVLLATAGTLVGAP